MRETATKRTLALDSGRDVVMRSLSPPSFPGISFVVFVFVARVMTVKIQSPKELGYRLIFNLTAFNGSRRTFSQTYTVLECRSRKQTRWLTLAGDSRQGLQNFSHKIQGLFSLDGSSVYPVHARNDQNCGKSR